MTDRNLLRLHDDIVVELRHMKRVIGTWLGWFGRCLVPCTRRLGCYFAPGKQHKTTAWRHRLIHMGFIKIVCRKVLLFSCFVIRAPRVCI